MKRSRFLICLLLWGLFPAFSDAISWNKAYQDYFDYYKDIAISQMQQYGIPASITLAQGVLESGAGNSELARKSNNHFGIKCNGWTGRRVYHDDDERDDDYDTGLDTNVDPVMAKGQNAVADKGAKAETDDDGYMRFSIIWNQNHRSLVDLDAHAKEPTGQEIAFNSHKSPSHTRAGGTLDVDMIRPTRTGVENIYWENAESLPDGNYRFFIVNYDGGRNHDCEAKLKVGNRTFLYRVPSIHKGSPATIATVTIRNHQMENIEQSRYLVN